MKPTTNTQTVESQGIKDSVSFGIKESGFAHIFNVLRNQLYSDKILAVVREYSCNAVDAHVAAGKGDVPIKVTLPNRLNPNLSIRDYGDALDDNDIQNIYAFYGESTKRNTNDQVGMLGIGSKSAFAYGDNFVINSYLNGKKHTYNAFIDPSQVGQISKLDVSDTDEENGIEIVVPVRDGDADEFVSKAQLLFKYFPVKPQICGTSEFDYENAETLFEGEGWVWKKTDDRYGDAVAVMGCIGYPISGYSLNLRNDDHSLNNLLQPNLVLKFDIGDLEISASREKLQFTDKTRKAIIDRLKVVEQEVVDKVMEQFGTCDSMFAAKSMYGSLMDWTSGLYDFRDILSKKLTWKGENISNDSYHFDWDKVNDHTDKSIAKFVVYKKPNRGFKYRAEKTEHLQCEKNVVVIKNDLGHSNGMIGRVLPLIIDQGKKVYMITFKGSKAEKEFLKEYNLDAPMVLASTLEKKKVSDYYGSESSGNGNSSAHSSKHSVSAFELDWDVIKSEAKGSSWYRNKTKSAYFNAVEVDIANDSGIYLVIDRFNIQSKDSKEYTPWEFHSIKECLAQYDIELPEKVYAFKNKVAEKAAKNPNMINLWDWMIEKFTNLIEEKDMAQKIVDHNVASTIEDRGWSNLESLSLIAEKLVDQESEFAQYANQFIAMYDEHGHKAYRGVRAALVDLVGVVEADKILNVEPSANLNHMQKVVAEKYSMLSILDSWEFRQHRASGCDKVANYVNIVDVASI